MRDALEQMPNLLNFIKRNATLDGGDHTVLISHSADDVLTTQTGLYGDNTGVFIPRFGLVEPGASSSSAFLPSSFFLLDRPVSDISAGSDNAGAWAEAQEECGGGDE